MTQLRDNRTVTINRSLIGIIAMAMLVGAGSLWLFAGNQNIWSGACLKVGVVMSALWLALPTILRSGTLGQASWGTVIGFMGLALLLTGKRVDFRVIVPMLLTFAIAIAFLRPKSKVRSR